MIQNIILAATLVVAFFLSISSFLLGLRMGKDLSNNKLPTVQLNPVKKAIQAVEQHKQSKQDKKLQDEYEDVMSASRETMLDAIGKEVK